MSVTPAYPLWRGSARLLMLSTAVTAAAAAAVLAVGTHDVHLLRLGLVAALWTALLAAFAMAQLRREARSSVDHAQHLRATYQLELEREVTARREHALRVERELRQQAELSQRSELVELRTEIAAMRARLELLGGSPLQEKVTLRAESTRLLPLPVLAPRFGPGRALTPASDESQSRHGALNRKRPIPDAHRGATPSPGAQRQRTVGDLIAAHGSLPAPRRRRSHANTD